MNEPKVSTLVKGWAPSLPLPLPLPPPLPPSLPPAEPSAALAEALARECECLPTTALEFLRSGLAPPKLRDRFRAALWRPIHEHEARTRRAGR